MSALELRLERERLAPGERVVGSVVVRAPISPRSIEVLLGLYETTRDFREAAWEAGTGPLHTGPAAAGTVLAFAIDLPPWAPPPYASRWGSIAWEVDAKADIARGRDAHAITRLVVLPPGVGDDQLAGAGATYRQAPAAGPGGAFGGAVVAAAPGGMGGPPAPGVPAAPSAQPSAAGAHPPGWYPDPWLEKRLRWWDGSQWTGELAD